MCRAAHESLHQFNTVPVSLRIRWRAHLYIGKRPDDATPDFRSFRAYGDRALHQILHSCGGPVSCPVTPVVQRICLALAILGMHSMMATALSEADHQRAVAIAKAQAALPD